MAIAQYNSVAYALANPVTSQTISGFDVGTGSDRLLIVHILGDVAATTGVTSVTYAGTDFTTAGGKLATIRVGSDRSHDIWFLRGPASGSNDIVINRGSSGLLITAAFAYTGVDQTTGLTTATTGSDSTADTTWNGSITTTTANSWIFVGVRDSSGRTMSSLSGWTLRQESSGFGMHGGDSNATVSITTHNLSASYSSSVQDSYILGEILEASTGSSASSSPSPSVSASPSTSPSSSVSSSPSPSVSSSPSPSVSSSPSPSPSSSVSSSPSPSVSSSPSPSPSPGSVWTLVANDGASGTDSSVTTAALDTTGAEVIVIHVACDAGATPTVSDSKSNTWTALTPVSSTVKSALYYCFNPTVGTGHTFSQTTAFSYSSIEVQAWSNSDVDSFSIDNESGTASASVTTQQPGSITPTNDGALLITGLGFTGTGETASIDSGFTETDEVGFSSGVNYGSSMAYFTQSSAAAINPTWTRTGSAAPLAATMVAIQGAGSSASSSPSPSASSSPSPSESSSPSPSVSSSPSSSVSSSPSSSPSPSVSSSPSPSVSSSPSPSVSSSPSPSESSSPSPSVSSSPSSSVSSSISSSPSSSPSSSNSPSSSPSTSVSSSPSSSPSTSPSPFIWVPVTRNSY